MMIWRPVMAEPAIYKMRDVATWVTINDVLRANEILDLKAAMAERASPAG